MGGATVLPWYTANASPISSASFTKSITNVADLSGWMRLSLDRVCTAASPVRVLSTYMAASLGWSKPVWNFSATTMICHLWRSSTTRSVMTTTLWNTSASSAECSDDSRCASQAIELDLPEPAECCTR